MDWDLISVFVGKAARVEVEVREMGTDTNDLANRETACSGQRRLARIKNSQRESSALRIVQPNRKPWAR